MTFSRSSFFFMRRSALSIVSPLPIFISTDMFCVFLLKTENVAVNDVVLRFCSQTLFLKMACKRDFFAGQSPIHFFHHKAETQTMARICAITGKRPVKGRRIIHKGQSKKSGGIGLQLVKQTKRRFRPNVQHIRVKLPNGSVKRLWVSVKAIKAGLVEKA